MVDLNVISDSSFFICFCDDIFRHDCLIRIVSFDGFNFIIGPIIKDEICKSPRHKIIEDHILPLMEIMDYYRFGEILRPFLSLNEITKGEHEVIAISCIFSMNGYEFLAVIDDAQIIKYIKKNFPALLLNIIGTIGFIEKCCNSFKVLANQEAIEILKLIKESRFRIKSEIVENSISRIKECQDGKDN